MIPSTTVFTYSLENLRHNQKSAITSNMLSGAKTYLAQIDPYGQ